MSDKRYQQSFLFLVVLILPSLVIAGFGWMLLTRERALEEGRVGARAVEVAEVRQAVLDRLEGINSATQSVVAAPSSPIVLAAVVDEGGALILPWEDESARIQFSFSKLETSLARRLAEARNLEDGKDYARAAELYLQALQGVEDDSQWAFV